MSKKKPAPAATTARRPDFAKAAEKVARQATSKAPARAAAPATPPAPAPAAAVPVGAPAEVKTTAYVGPVWKLAGQWTAGDIQRELASHQGLATEKELFELRDNDAVAEEASVVRVQQMAEEILHLRRLVDADTVAAGRYYRAMKEVDTDWLVLGMSPELAHEIKRPSAHISLFDTEVIDTALEKKAQGIDEDASYKESSLAYMQKTQSAWACFSEAAKQAACRSVAETVAKLRAEAQRLRSLKLQPDPVAKS